MKEAQVLSCLFVMAFYLSRQDGRGGKEWLEVWSAVKLCHFVWSWMPAYPYVAIEHVRGKTHGYSTAVLSCHCPRMLPPPAPPHTINQSIISCYFLCRDYFQRLTQFCCIRINNQKLVHHSIDRLKEMLSDIYTILYWSLKLEFFELPKCGGRIWIFLQVMLVLMTVKLLLLPQLKHDRWNQGAQTVAVAPVSKELCTHPMPLHHRTAPEKSLLLLNLCCAPVDSDKNPETKSSLWFAEKLYKRKCEKSNQNRCCFFHKISRLLVNFWNILTNNILEQIFGGGE